MTAKKPLPEIAAKGYLVQIRDTKCVTTGYYVKNFSGWIGPSRKTARGAIKEWNRTMGQNWDTARLLCYRLLKLNRSGGIDAVLDEIDSVIQHSDGKIRRGE